MESNKHAPTACERCSSRLFNQMVCARCGWRPDCPACGDPVFGRVDRVFCSQRCKKAMWDREHPQVTGADGAARVLVRLGDDELRDLLRRVMATRETERARVEGRKANSSGRLRVRWKVRAGEL